MPILKLRSILAVANLLAHNNISQICYSGQISLQSAAVNGGFSDILTPMGGNIYFAGDGTWNVSGKLESSSNNDIKKKKSFTMLQFRFIQTTMKGVVKFLSYTILCSPFIERKRFHSKTGFNLPLL